MTSKQSHTSDNADPLQKHNNPQGLGFYGLIYISTNLVNGKIYIGQTTTFNDYYIGSGLHFSRAVKKYGRKNFVSHHLQYSKDKEELDRLEVEYIASFNSTDPAIGYNLALGGNGTGKHSESTRKKMSQAKKHARVIQRKWAGLSDKDLFKHLQQLLTIEDSNKMGLKICPNELFELINDRYKLSNLSDAKQVLANKFNKQVLSHKAFIDYCIHYKENLKDGCDFVFGLTPQEFEDYYSNAYRFASRRDTEGLIRCARKMSFVFDSY